MHSQLERLTGLLAAPVYQDDNDPDKADDHNDTREDVREFQSRPLFVDPVFVACSINTRQ